MIIKNHGQKNPPPGCNLGPKFSASGWSLVRKKNDELAVQYEDCPWLLVWPNGCMYYHVYWKRKYVSKNYWGRWGRKRLMGQKARIFFWKKIGTYFFNYPTLNQFLKKWVKIKFFSKNPPFFCGRPRKWVFPNGNFSILWNTQGYI